MANKIPAITGAVLPMVGLTIWMTVLREGAPTIEEFFLGPLLVGCSMIFWILFLHIRMCRESVGSLGFVPGPIVMDLLIGIGLGVAFLALKWVEQPVLNTLFPPRPPSEEIITLLRGIAGSNVLLVLWLGPVVWIGVAGFEELWRAFMLRHTSDLLRGPAGRWTAIVVVAILVGLAHSYQGPGGVLSIGLKSVLMGWFFLARGRIVPLIVAHGVYDSVQVIAAVAELRHAFPG